MSSAPLKIRVKILGVGGRVPHRAHSADAGYDCSLPHDVTLPPHAVTKVPLGFAIELPQHSFALLKPRSSIAAKGVWPIDPPIDPGYRGEVVAILYNSTGEAMSFKAGDRLCQMVILPRSAGVMEEGTDLAASWDGRGTGGFGSTGIGTVINSPILPTFDLRGPKNITIEKGE